jgi:hypothetical protein
MAGCCSAGERTKFATVLSAIRLSLPSTVMCSPDTVLLHPVMEMSLSASVKVVSSSSVVASLYLLRVAHGSARQADTSSSARAARSSGAMAAARGGACGARASGTTDDGCCQHCAASRLSPRGSARGRRSVWRCTAGGGRAAARAQPSEAAAWYPREGTAPAGTLCGATKHAVPMLFPGVREPMRCVRARRRNQKSRGGTHRGRSALRLFCWRLRASCSVFFRLLMRSRGAVS